MSEPSGDSSNPPPADPSAPPPQKGSLARAPRANPPSVFNPKDAPANSATTPPGVPPGFAEFMAWMQSGGAGGAVEEPPAGRTRIPREQKKFSRRTNDPASTEPAPEGAPTADNGGGTAPAATGERRADGAPILNIPLEGTGTERVRRSNKNGWFGGSLSTLLLQLLGLGLLVGAFFLGRATMPKTETLAPVAGPAAPGTAPEDKTPAPLPSALQAKMDEAIKAESVADFDRAKTLFGEIRDAGGRVHGLTLHLAQLAYFQDNMPQTLILLNESISKGEEVAACYNLRGTLANRTGGVTKGIDDLEVAAKLDPFNARYAFFVGEALRRAGKPQAALDYLNQALYRLREPGLYSFYQLKVRLAQVTLGQEGQFADEMAKRLAENPPPVDWLFTAAAVEMQHGKSAAAVPYLEKACSLVPQDEIDMRLRDFFFFGFSDDKEVGRFYASIKAAARSAASPAPTAAPTPFGSSPPAPNPAATPGLPAPIPLETPKI